MSIPRPTTLLSSLLVFAAVFSHGGEVIRDLGEINRIVERNADGTNAFETVAVALTPIARSNGDFMIENETGATQVKDRAFWPDKAASGIVPGDRIRVRGDIVKGKNGLLYTYARKIDILSHGPTPHPREVTAEDFYRGRHLHRLIRITGTVIDAFTDEIDPHFIFLIISCGRESVYVSTSKPENGAPQAAELLDSTVSVVGTCVRTRAPRRDNRKGLQICASSLSAITVIKPPPADRFDVPACTNVTADIQAIMTGNIRRRRIAGKVIAAWRGNRVLVRTPHGISRVDLLGASRPSCGSVIEAVGIPETDLYNINLSGAIWRPTQEAVPPDPPSKLVEFRKLVTDDQGRREIKPAYHGQPIRLIGTVRELLGAFENGIRLTLECGHHLVPVEINPAVRPPEGLEVGCRTEIAGVCIMNIENWRPQSPFPHIEGFILAVRSPQDVTILSRPPWWTAGRLMLAIGILLGTLLAILLWNLALHRVVERRSRELLREKVGHVKSELKIQERTRLAVELHDSVAQNLTGVSMEIDTAERLADEDPGSMHRHLGIAAKTLQSCRDELRNCLWDLRSHALEEDNMNEAIRRTVAPQITGVELVIRFNVPRKRLSDDTAHALLRIIRELVVNAVRHGKAQTVRIAGSLEDDRIMFSVRDDGTGFNPESRPGVLQGHFGLQGVKERVSKFGGSLTIDSAPGKGSRITVDIRI